MLNSQIAVILSNTRNNCAEGLYLHKICENNDIRYALVVLLCSALALPGSGQMSYGGIPASFSLLKKATLSSVPVIDMESVDNNQLLMNERSDPNNLKTFHFAKGFNVNISPNNSGQWTVNENMKIWRLGLRSKGAWSLNLIFDKFIIPQVHRCLFIQRII